MIPRNEQGTIVLFTELADELGYTFKEIGTKCPDAIMEKEGKPVRVEFEYRSKAFQAHKHNPDDVDLIVCWEDNWPAAPVPVLSLEKYVTLAHRTEEAVPSWWQRLLGWRNDVAIACSDMARSVKIARTRNKVCPICGGNFQARCKYTAVYTKSNGDLIMDGMALLTCRQCGYIDSTNVDYYAGANLD